MEAAGLTIGAVALISLFKDCVDLFSMISAARTLGQDAEILDTKLDVERMILLQWADRVRLYKPGELHIQLSDPETQQTIERILSSIKSLLSEGEALEKKYGLQKINSSEHNNNTTRGYRGTSASRMERFLRDFANLGIDDERRNKKIHGKPLTTTRRLRWAIVDKENFNRLINDLSYFNSRLSALVPVASPSTLDMSEQDLSHIRNTAELEMIAKACSDSQPSVTIAAIAAKRAILQVRVLQRLWFRWIDERRANVKDAHFNTLRWSLDPPSGALKWDDLSTWLQKDSGIYWLAGKAGSGKSTLMKYLSGHTRTRELLQLWAGSSELLISSFFFYHLGWPEQKSQVGLLRSLLFQILDKLPMVIEAVLPNVWREAENDSKELAVPSVAEMNDALVKVCSTHLVNRKLVLLIDGIDEYEGRDLDVANFIEKLGSIANVKILVSSRPLAAFCAAFSQKPKMDLPDLTRDDIAAYIDDEVASHHGVVRLSEIEPDGAKEILEELVNKASGVFLWVVLACRSVVEGLNACDTIADLRARVAELPKEVEDLLQLMLDKIEPAWREEAVKLLRLVYVNQALEGVDPIPTLGLYLVCEQRLELSLDIQKKSLSKTCRNTNLAKCQIMDGRLRSRCCGLLEVQKASPSLLEHQFCACSTVNPHHDPILDSHVIFMHRAVYEFLSMPYIWQRDFTRIQDSTFNGHAVLSSMWAHLAATVSPSSTILENCMNNALAHSYYGEITECLPEFTACNLSKLQLVSGRLNSSPFLKLVEQCLIHGRRCQRYCDDFSLGLAFAIELGMIRVVQFAFEKTKRLHDLLIHASDHGGLFFDCEETQDGQRDFVFCLACKSRGPYRVPSAEHGVLETVYPMLYHAVCRPLLHSLKQQSLAVTKRLVGLPSLQMIQYVVERAHGPNEEFWKPDPLASVPRTTWTEWIWSCGSLSYTMQETADITKILLNANAEVPPPGTDDFTRLKRLASASIKSTPQNTWELHHVTDNDEGVWAEVRGIIKSRLKAKYGASAAEEFEENDQDATLERDNQFLTSDGSNENRRMKRSSSVAITASSAKRPRTMSPW